jgi:hypothetical protein
MKFQSNVSETDCASIMRADVFTEIVYVTGDEKKINVCGIIMNILF